MIVAEHHGICCTFNLPSDSVPVRIQKKGERLSMLAVASIELEARKPAANRRRWQLDLGKVLLGAWVAEVRFGRIGSRGRLLRRVFASDDEALAYMRRGLRRRATASTRIGVPYLCVRSSAEARELLNSVGIDTANTISR